MEDKQLREKLSEQMRYHIQEERKLRGQIEEIDARLEADWQKGMLGKCFINTYGDSDETSLDFFSIYRVENFDKSGEAYGTAITVSARGLTVEHTAPIWKSDLTKEDSDLSPFPPAIFAEIADRVMKQISSDLQQFLNDLEGWKTKRPDTTTSFWTRLQQALSSTGLKLKPLEKES